MRTHVTMRAARRLLAAAAVFAVVSSSSAGAQTAEPYELNGIFSTTGFGAFLGAAAAKSFKAMEGYVNRTGGIHGRPIQLNVLDDQSNPQVTLQLVGTLSAKHVPLIIGPMLTAACNATLPLIVNGPVAYCVSPFVTPPPGGFMFAQGGSPTDGSVVALRYFKERGIHRIAMLNATDATGQALDRASTTAFSYPEFKQLQLVSHLFFAPADPTVAAQMAQIKAAHAEAVITWNVGSAFGTVVRGLHDAGLDGLPVIAGGGNAAATQMRALGGFALADVHYAVSPSFVDDARVSKAVLAKQAVFRQVMTDAGLPSDGASAAPWDITLVEIDALRHLPPNPSAEAVRNYISHLNGFVGTNGVYDFRFGNQSGADQTLTILVHWDAAKGRFFASSTPGGHVLR